MDITPKDAVETKALGFGRRISIVIGILTAMVPTVLAAIGGLDWITANLPLLCGSMGGIVTGGVGAFVAIRRMRIDAQKAGLILLLLLPMFLWCSGCNTFSDQQTAEAKEVALAYYSQPKTAQLWVIEGTNCTFTVSGFSRFEMNTPVPPISIMPKDPSSLAIIGDAIKTAVPYAAGAYLLHGNIGNGSHTVNNNAAATP